MTINGINFPGHLREAIKVATLQDWQHLFEDLRQLEYQKIEGADDGTLPQIKASIKTIRSIEGLVVAAYKHNEKS